VSKTNQELVKGGSSTEIASGVCDGKGFSAESTCCIGHKYLKCPHKHCVTRPVDKEYDFDDSVDECDTDWTWTIWKKGEKREDGFFTLAIYHSYVINFTP